jgi:bifunctional non-homologous end joining protein LigD
MEGVLKSWAIPKGPSMNQLIRGWQSWWRRPSYSYKDFEGVIPEGNYGGGKVIVWDNGTYT